MQHHAAISALAEFVSSLMSSFFLNFDFCLCLLKYLYETGNMQNRCWQQIAMCILCNIML